MSPRLPAGRLIYVRVASLSNMVDPHTNRKLFKEKLQNCNQRYANQKKQNDPHTNRKLFKEKLQICNQRYANQKK